MRRFVKFNCAVVATCVLLLLAAQLDGSEAKGIFGGRKKTGGSSSSSSSASSTRRQSSSSGSATRPTSSSKTSNTYHNSDQSRLSYANNNAAPNRNGGTYNGNNQAQPIGWNVPKQQGPPPAYSATNPVGGARTNVHEAAPAYKPNYATNNAQSPIRATQTQGVQSSYPRQQPPAGATYYPAGQAPAGASYYPSAGHVPAGATYHPAGHVPAGATYYPSSGHMPAGGSYYGGGAPSYYPSAGHMPAGATYIPAGAAIPVGAVYYAQPPRQSSSGLGFGSGLAAGALGGALLTNALTPSHTRYVDRPPVYGNNNGGNDDKVIIINNGPPGSVTTSEVGGATVITTNNAAAVPQQPNYASPNYAPQPGVAAGPPVNMPPAVAGGAAAFPMDGQPQMPVGSEQPQAPPAVAAAEQPPTGGIICVPMMLNETDPNDSSKMIEVEKVACYPAPPTEPQQPLPSAAGGPAPLAPMQPLANDYTSQQLQQGAPTQPPLLPSQSSIRAATSGAQQKLGFGGGSLLMLLCMTLVGLRSYF